jgi:hypothetical protein
MKVVDAMYTEVSDFNVVEAIIGVVENILVKANVECQVVEANEGPKADNEVITESQFAKKIKVAYPMIEEELIDFLNRCRLKNYEVMLCPKCNFVFAKEATKGLFTGVFGKQED